LSDVVGTRKGGRQRALRKTRGRRTRRSGC
jgi:hypothetical protein